MIAKDKAKAEKLFWQAKLLLLEKDDGRWTPKPEAEKLLHEALLLNPKHPRVLASLGRFSYHRNNWEESIKYNRQALEIAPRYAAALYNLACAEYMLNGVMSNPIRDRLIKTVRLNPKLGQLPFTIANIPANVLKAITGKPSRTNNFPLLLLAAAGAGLSHYTAGASAAEKQSHATNTT